jgi:hypothetical protein
MADPTEIDRILGACADSAAALAPNIRESNWRRLIRRRDRMVVLCYAGARLEAEITEFPAVSFPWGGFWSAIAAEGQDMVPIGVLLGAGGLDKVRDPATGAFLLMPIMPEHPEPPDSDGPLVGIIDCWKAAGARARGARIVRNRGRYGECARCLQWKPDQRSGQWKAVALSARLPWAQA